MYKSHQQIESLSDTSATIWKYMSMSNYVSILKDGLHLSRVDKYPDKHDGHMPEFTSESLLNGCPLGHEVASGMNRSYKNMRQYAYACCWTQNEYESDVMWNSFSNKENGVVIKSTFQRLCDSIIDERDIFVGVVNYDYPSIYVGNIYWPVLSKRKQFRDEREIRMFYADPLGRSSTLTENNSPHSKVSVDLDILIDSVLFHPALPDTTIKNLSMDIATTYGDIRVPNRSSLYSNP